MEGRLKRLSDHIIVASDSDVSLAVVKGRQSTDNAHPTPRRLTLNSGAGLIKGQELHPPISPSFVLMP
jgi:hypothetical protein